VNSERRKINHQPEVLFLELCLRVCEKSKEWNLAVGRLILYNITGIREERLEKKKKRKMSVTTPKFTFFHIFLSSLKITF
jgi:hypothetical protein